jgi:hypothetical protein
VKVGELTFGLYQGFYLNDENGDEYKDEYGDRLKGWYWSNWFSTKWKIPTGIDVYGLGELNYIPRGTIKKRYLPGGEYIGPERKGPTVEIGHELEFGRIDWIGNFRRGVAASIDNDNEYNLYTASWDKSISAKLAGYAPLTSFLGISSRISTAVYFDEPNTSAGDSLRGILDDDVDADAYLYLNLDIPVRVIRFMPYEWFGSAGCGSSSSSSTGARSSTSARALQGRGRRLLSLRYVGDRRFGGHHLSQSLPQPLRSDQRRLRSALRLENRQRPGLGDLELFLGLSHMY